LINIKLYGQDILRLKTDIFIIFSSRTINTHYMIHSLDKPPRLGENDKFKFQ